MEALVALKANSYIELSTRLGQIQDMNEILDPIRRHDSKISMGRKHTVPIKEHASSK